MILIMRRASFLWMILCCWLLFSACQESVPAGSVSARPEMSLAMADSSAAVSVPLDSRGSLQEASHSAGLPRSLEIPSAPALLVGEAARLNYVCANYWYNFDFADTGWIADTGAFMRVFSDWTGLLSMLPEEKAADRAGTLIRAAARNVPLQKHFFSVMGLYFNDPNSPYRNETIFIEVLQAYLASPLLPPEDRLRPELQLERALKNRPGALAADIRYQLPDGSRGTLYGLQAEYVLLLFYNPGCEDCGRVEKALASSAVVKELSAQGRLKVLAVYPDEDLTLWQQHLPDMPSGWIVACEPEQQINREETYFLPAIPNLYLLDQQKKVVLKDVSVEEALARLQSVLQEG